jgi:hypothetical protein
MLLWRSARLAVQAGEPPHWTNTVEVLVKALLVVLTCMLLPALAAAQSHDQHAAHAGKQTREIRALSDEEVKSLLAGEGMGFALAAELNSYPGPRHVLELAEQLALSAGQRSQVQAIFDEMSREAAALGARLVEQERALDREFAARTITAASLDRHTAEAARIQGRIRASHLRAHLKTTALLTAEQVHQYDMLRGYVEHRH